MVERVLAVLVVTVTLVTGAPARAQDEGPAWARAAPIERHEPAVVAWRLTDGWSRELVAVALAEGRPRSLRERALALLGATGDDPATLQALAELQLHGDPHLAPHVGLALGRVWARRRAFEAIAQLSARGAVDGDQGGARELAGGLDVAALLETCALARDPLFAEAAAATRLVGAALPADISIDEQLVAVARSGPAAARAAALEALAARGRAQAIAAGVAAALRAAVEGGDDAQRAAAVDAVVHLRGDEALEAFYRRALAADVPEAARVLAARGLGRAGLLGATGWLRSQLRGAGPELQAAVSAALVRLGAVEPELLGALLEAALAGGAGARDAADGLLALAPDRRDPLLRAGLEDAEPERRQRALELVYAAAPAGLAPLLAELAGSVDAPWHARHLAVLALGRVGGPVALGALVAVLGAGDGGSDAAPLRRAAVDALRACPPAPERRGEPAARAARAALEAALEERDPGLRRAALEALAAWGDPASRPALAAALERPSRTTAERVARARACERLALTEPQSAARVLALTVEDGEAALALAVLSYARLLDEAAAVPAALELLSHRSAGVRRAAGAELRRRRTAGGGPELDEGAPLFSPDHSRAVQGWREWWSKRRPR